uniref:Sec23_trunk domain-containing protein n=1 Tax=Macrostomum lignano TaxID=282301 RepID=A0A1I8HWU5_9PLAT
VRVVGLPSQTCYSEKKLTETSNVVRASVPTILGAPCLVCLLGNGHLIANSLPSLRPLMDVDYMPLVDFSNDLNDMLADLYIPCDLPEPPKKNFLEKFGQNLFGSGASSIDREQLCVHRHLQADARPNMEGVQARAAGASSEIGLAMQ